MTRFVQPVPALPHRYGSDHVLHSWLDRLLGEDGHASAAPLLEALAEEVERDLVAAGDDAERHPPELVGYDGWGARVDVVRTSAGWELLRQAAARHGLVALPYEAPARDTWGAGARVLQQALIHLYAPASSTFTCPVAMADGAATVLAAEGVDDALRQRLLGRLLSRDPDEAWTSGQWMTETEGGSDVGRATTRARQDATGAWHLHGEKWFCSSVNSEFSIALARTEAADGTVRERSTGLACFVIPRYADLDAERGERRTAPGVQLHRLKDKLGTRALPSAEVRLDGALAWPVGDPHEPGLKRMLALVQITRLHNAANAAAGMRHGVLAARSYASSRESFGRRLDEHPLHRETLGHLAVEAEAAYALTAMCFELLGRVEVHGDEAAAHELRLAATLAKAGTAKWAVAHASEVLECFGGPGYVEDTGMPRLLRDAQVLPIWEGTTNVLSLDVLRSFAKDDALTPYLARVDAALALAPDELAGALKVVRDDIVSRTLAVARDPERGQAGARVLLERMAALLAGAALLEHAAWQAERGEQRGTLVAALWLRRTLLGEDCAGEHHDAFELLLDGVSPGA